MNKEEQTIDAKVAAIEAKASKEIQGLKKGAMKEYKEVKSKYLSLTKKYTLLGWLKAKAGEAGASSGGGWDLEATKAALASGKMSVNELAEKRGMTTNGLRRNLEIHKSVFAITKEDPKNQRSKVFVELKK